MVFREELGATVSKIVENKLEEIEHVNDVLYRSLKKNKQNIGVIPEIKLSSPSQGKLNEEINENEISKMSETFEELGCVAISVLTEPMYFKGEFEFLKIVKNSTELPVIAKGFFFNMSQLIDCNIFGADSYLLMVKIFRCINENIYDFMKLSKEINLEPVIEVNSKPELNEILKLAPNIIEINNRNIYSDLSIDYEKVKLSRYIPDDIAVVSASGIDSKEDIIKINNLSEGRIDAVLVGSSIMRSDNPEEKLIELLEAGRNIS